MNLIDLTHTFGPVMPAYPGDPIPSLIQRCQMPGDQCSDFALHTTMHIGTHIDAPLHMIEGGKKLSEIEVERFVGKGHLIDARGQDVIDVSVLDGHAIGPGDVVLILTGFSKHFGSEAYFRDYPVLSDAFAERCVELGVTMIGLDTPSPDREPYAVHKILLKNEILIIENLTNLEALTAVPSFTVMALPMKIEADAGPIRVVAQVR